MNKESAPKSAPAAGVAVYGLKNCDSCRKARRWLEQHRIPHQFRDLREAGIEAERLHDWCQRVDWKVLLNRKSATWRCLDSSNKDVSNQRQACELMTANPLLVKRPVLEARGVLLVGFDAVEYQQSLCGSKA